MTKLRRSLLVTLVLAATVLAVLGVETAEAARARDRAADSAKSPVRRVLGPCTNGEPDNGNNGAPIPKVTSPTVVGPAGTSWFLGQWFQLTWKLEGKRHTHAR
ncbi:MAG: hypothetical protein HZA61_10210 [Candidatus Eisenbacteria bacterium]|uniref:Secreted protein n=1 Tax=Eiseniibacteriota bacterium TaxID=2212470 RepID=A0A933SEK4_UNCEI|nr:hypothetical protein [Candidatus Eisenbacteria bacterium]